MSKRSASLCMLLALSCAPEAPVHPIAATRIQEISPEEAILRTVKAAAVPVRTRQRIFNGTVSADLYTITTRSPALDAVFIGFDGFTHKDEIFLYIPKAQERVAMHERLSHDAMKAQHYLRKALPGAYDVTIDDAVHDLALHEFAHRLFADVYGVPDAARDIALRRQEEEYVAPLVVMAEGKKPLYAYAGIMSEYIAGMATHDTILRNISTASGTQTPDERALRKAARQILETQYPELLATRGP